MNGEFPGRDLPRLPPLYTSPTSPQARFNEKYYFQSGVETVVLGGACATIAFVVGRFVASFAGEAMID